MQCVCSEAEGDSAIGVAGWPGGVIVGGVHVVFLA